MGRIGKKKKKGPSNVAGPTSESYTKKLDTGMGSDLRSGLGSNFTENDIEFMKKAI